MRCIAMLLVVLLVPAGAIAQELSHSFGALNRQGVLVAGESIWITCDLSGEGEYEEIKAKFGGLTNSAITVEVENLPRGTWPGAISTDDGYRMEIPESRVSRIQLRPGVKRWGLIIGTAAGVGVGIGVAAALGAEDCGECYGVSMLLLGGAGAGAGAITDSARKRAAREVVYLDSGSAESTFSYSLSPIVSNKRKGALFTVTW